MGEQDTTEGDGSSVDWTPPLPFSPLNLLRMRLSTKRINLPPTMGKMRTRVQVVGVGEQDTTEEGRFKRGLDSSIAVLSAELTQDETIY